MQSLLGVLVADVAMLATGRVALCRNIWNIARGGFVRPSPGSVQSAWDTSPFAGGQDECQVKVSLGWCEEEDIG